MASRPVFVPLKQGSSLIAEIPIDFRWNPGLAPSQKKKNIAALHKAAEARNLYCLLEISSKSDQEIGKRLSAFNLKLKTDKGMIFLECVYQGSKVFRHGGPYADIMATSPREAKKDFRLRNSGELVCFEFMGDRYPTSPKNAFYDWLYLNALFPHWEWICRHVSYQGYTDIEFNPVRSINCQARAFAESIALSDRGMLERAVEDFSYFAGLLPAI